MHQDNSFSGGMVSKHLAGLHLMIYFLQDIFVAAVSLIPDECA
jgi:hypothetical protein